MIVYRPATDDDWGCRCVAQTRRANVYAEDVGPENAGHAVLFARPEVQGGSGRAGTRQSSGASSCSSRARGEGTGMPGRDKLQRRQSGRVGASMRASAIASAGIAGDVGIAARARSGRKVLGPRRVLNRLRQCDGLGVPRATSLFSATCNHMYAR